MMEQINYEELVQDSLQRIEKKNARRKIKNRVVAICLLVLVLIMILVLAFRK